MIPLLEDDDEDDAPDTVRILLSCQCTYDVLVETPR
jgi:hypothetical protein